MKILFVCQGNINRSQMAEVFLKHLMPGVEISSAGTFVPSVREGRKVSEISTKGAKAMQEIGFDTSNNIVKGLRLEMVDAADRVILVGDIVEGGLPPYLRNSPKLEKWNIPDPGYLLISHTATRDRVLEKVKELVARLS